jgi:hypothetical protein
MSIAKGIVRHRRFLRSFGRARSVLGTAALSVVVAAAGACDQAGSASAPPVEDSLGSVSLAVTLSSTAVINAITYNLSGNGIVPLVGQINVTDPAATPTAAIGGVPAGLGYLVTLSATSADGLTSCNGSAPVDVVAGQSSGVTVILQCRGPDTGGVVVVSGGFNACPAITSYSGSPVVVSVGGSIAVSATAVDPDGNTLAYVWTTTSGTFDNPTAPMTSFTCTAAGPATLTVAVSDGMCNDFATIPLTCVPFCAVRPDGTPCNDDNACTRSDQCLGGACVGSDPVVCTAGADSCHPAGVCAPATGQCSHPVAADGTSCPLAHSMAACTSGACQITACINGFGNCDLMSATGCEVSLFTSTTDCGMCGHACLPGVTCTAGFCVSPPPTGVTAAAHGWSVALTWNAAPGATSYEILRALSGSGTFQSLGMTSTTQFIDDQVATGVTYSYAVKSNSEGGTSLASATADATPLSKQICVGAQTMQRIMVFDATQSGRATPLRSIFGAATDLGFPQGVASNIFTGELFSSLIGGNVPVFALAASGNVPPLRVLSGAAPGQNFNALELDGAHREAFTADYDAGGKVVTLDDMSGALKRSITGAFTQLGHPASLALDAAHDELFVGQSDAGLTFQQVQVFGRADNGNIAPRRTLGLAGNTTVGGWSVVFDRAHDEILTTCNCNNVIAVFDRMATGDTAPKRTIQVTGLSRIYAMLLDPADDTLWIQGLSGLTTFQLMELPRGASGATSPSHAPVLLSAGGRLARCN